MIYKRLILTVLILALLTIVQMGWLDQQAEEYSEQGMKRTLVTYAVTRGLNGLISVIQGTEIAVEPVGVGMTFTPGQILDPVNDLVERFSLVVLASGTSFGIQRLLIGMSAWLWMNLVVSVLLILVLIPLWKPDLLSTQLRHTLLRGVGILLILRFVVPVSAIASEGVYMAFLQPKYEAASQQLEIAADQVEAQHQNDTEVVKAESLMDRIERLYDSAASAVDVRRRVNDLKNAVSDISMQVIDLLVVFLVQTLILPLLFLWLAYRLMVYVATVTMK